MRKGQRRAPPRPTLLIAQHDLRTIRIEAGGATLLLRYGFLFDGLERLPESVVLNGDEARGFFLSSTVKDWIAPTECGFTIRRRWSVMQSGKIRLVATLDLLPAGPAGGKTAPRPLRYLYPGVSAGTCGPGTPPRAFRGERTALPACVVVGSDDVGVCVSASAEDREPLGVRLEHAGDEVGGYVRVSFELPPREEQPADDTPTRRGDPGNGGQPDAVAGLGGLERAVIIQVATGEPGGVYGSGLRVAVPATVSQGPGMPEALARKPALRDAVRSFLASHLVDHLAVAGLRVSPQGDLLSAGASAEMAAHICRLYPEDPALVECALRLGDFCLTAQHSSGLFYGRYSLQRSSWVGLRGVPPDRADRPPLLSVEESSHVAASLLDLGDVLAGLGRTGTRFQLAGRRMVDAWFDLRGVFTPPPAVATPDGAVRAEEGLSSIGFLHPLLRVLDHDPRGRYRKAAQHLVAQWMEELPSPLDPPSSRQGRDPDSSAAMLLLEAALGASARRIRIPDVEAIVALLLPWVWVGGGADGGPAVALLDSYSRPRWRPCPYRLAYACLRLVPQCAGPSASLLKRIATLSLHAAERIALGTGHVRRVRWVGPAENRKRGDSRPAIETGTVDARVFAAEVGACLGMEAEGLW